MTRWPLLLAVLLTLAPPASGQAAEPPSPTLDDERAYKIGIEDVLKILVWGEEELTISQKVRPDGRITVPLVNDIAVAGMSTEQVRRRISTELSKYVRDPHVTVMVEESNSFRVYFLGEVKTQGPIQLYRPTRLLQALAAAGGLTEFSKKEVVVLRGSGDAEQRLQIDLKRLWSGDAGVENVYLEPGDTILVK